MIWSQVWFSLITKSLEVGLLSYIATNCPCLFTQSRQPHIWYGFPYNVKDWTVGQHDWDITSFKQCLFLFPYSWLYTMYSITYSKDIPLKGIHQYKMKIMFLYHQSNPMNHTICIYHTYIYTLYNINVHIYIVIIYTNKHNMYIETIHTFTHTSSHTYKYVYIHWG